MSEEHEKTCADCKCRDCNAITQMAERVDAYTEAKSLLTGVNWSEGNDPDPHELLLLANWFYYGEGDESDATQVTERIEAYKSAQSMIGSVTWAEHNNPSPHEFLLLANWLYYGDNGSDD